jgi:hypothetical protein
MPEPEVTRLNNLAHSIYDQAVSIAQVYTHERELQGSPFTIRASDGYYSVLADSEGSVVEDDPYNRVVLATIGRDNDMTEGSLFSLTVDPFVSPEAKVEAKKFSEYAIKVRSANLELSESNSDQRQLLHTVNQYVINEAWKHLSGMINANVPGAKEVELRTRKKNDRRQDLTFRRLLLRTIEQWFRKDYLAYGHALVHGLSTIVQKSVQSNKDLWIQLINRKRSFRPSLKDMQENGIVPDVNIARYKSLFSPIEWSEIVDSGLLREEEKLKDASVKLDNFQKIVEFVDFCKSLRIKIKDDPVFRIVRDIKRDRLKVCSWLKAEGRTRGPLRMWSAVGKNYDRSEVRQAFLPGAILSSLGKLEETSPGALSSWIVWNREDLSFELRHDLDPNKLPPLALERVSEYIRLLS